ncbi:hypothetical protein LCI18_005321 [Fusarium solani-melongenae]|uniref:Uncharacterized protein n=1 Tax=Fusarium solani subsp. cucurbitae TaxID=2747967 RepID=A0ACD3Z0I1_FUSSC|nr:hypothetical protein LCI18_005321 [Fusarium solani-melongenae]
MENASNWPQKRAEKGAEALRYKHDPLPQPDHIRLLDVRSRTTNSYIPLLTFRIGDCPPYAALSYTWGPPLETAESKAAYEGKKQTLHIQDGRKQGYLSVDRNLCEAIAAIQTNQWAEFLWADGVCINQDDNLEKKYQVPLMGEIYSRCQRAIAWLGADSSNAEEFHKLHTTVKDAVSRQGPFRNPAIQFLAVHSVEELESRLGIEIPRTWWNSYCTFLEQRRWFSRAWVKQEVALPPELLVSFNNFTLSWNDLWLVTTFLKQSLGAKLQYLRSPSGTRHTMPVGTEIMHLATLRDQCQRGGPTVYQVRPGDLNPTLQEKTGARTDRQLCCAYLEESIERIRDSDATKPKDKVYAILGIFKKFIQSPLDDLLSPEYNDSVTPEETFTRAAWFLLRELPILSTLSMVPDLSQRLLQDLPSWVPDYTFQKNMKPLPYIAGKYGMNASLASEEVMAYRQRDGNTLHLEGAVFDVIQSHGLPGPDEHDQFEITRSMMEYLKELFRLAWRASCDFSYPEPIINFLWRTQIANATRNTHGVILSEKHFSDWILGFMATKIAMYGEDSTFQSVMGLVQALRGHGNHMLPTRNEIYTLVAHMRENSETARGVEVRRNYSLFYDMFAATSIWRKVFLTRKGHFGLGPMSVQPGDEVWMLCGGKVLYVLRHHETLPDTYRFIGEAYVHGFMHGEVFRDGVGESVHRISLV